jgi:hypothetical protein
MCVDGRIVCAWSPYLVAVTVVVVLGHVDTVFETGVEGAVKI